MADNMNDEEDESRRMSNTIRPIEITFLERILKIN